jgi:hypothetical protein
MYITCKRVTVYQADTSHQKKNFDSGHILGQSNKAYVRQNCDKCVHMLHNA